MLIDPNLIFYNGLPFDEATLQELFATKIAMNRRNPYVGDGKTLLSYAEKYYELTLFVTKPIMIHNLSLKPIEGFYEALNILGKKLAFPDGKHTLFDFNYNHLVLQTIDDIDRYYNERVKQLVDSSTGLLSRKNVLIDTVEVDVTKDKWEAALAKYKLFIIDIQLDYITCVIYGAAESKCSTTWDEIIFSEAERIKMMLGCDLYLTSRRLGVTHIDEQVGELNFPRTIVRVISGKFGDVTRAYNYSTRVDSYNYIFCNNDRWSQLSREFVWNKQLKLKTQKTQAFLKMLEILHNIKDVLPKKIQAVHTCEAPGMFVQASIHFTSRHNIEYDWCASTLEESDIGDDHHFISGNRSRWSFRDITDPTYLNELYEKQSWNFFTSDVGIPNENYLVNREDTMYYLDMCSYTAGLAALRVGGIMVLKLYLPSSNLHVLYHSGLDLFDSIRVIKPSQNPRSHEYYCVLIGMKKKLSIEAILQLRSVPPTLQDSPIELMDIVTTNLKQKMAFNSIYFLQDEEMKPYITKLKQLKREYEAWYQPYLN